MHRGRSLAVFLLFAATAHSHAAEWLELDSTPPAPARSTAKLPAPTNCSHGPAPVLFVRTSQTAVSHNHTRSNSEIVALADRPAWWSGEIGGIYSSTPDYEYRVEFEDTQLPNGRVCSAYRRVEVDIRFVETEISIDRAIKKTSCWYGALLQHEMTHYNAEGQALQEWEPAFVQIFQRALANRGSTEDYAVEAAHNQLKYNLEQLIFNSMSDMLADIGQRQLEMDTPETYQAVANACPNE